MASSDSEELLLGVWQNVDASQNKQSISRFTFGKIAKGHCKAARVYADATDVGDCSVDPAKHSFTFVITGAEDDPEQFSFKRTGATLVLEAEDWGTQTFALVKDADVATELAKRG
jgi:hypothetical protein